jgi:hypothetical protein
MIHYHSYVHATERTYWEYKVAYVRWQGHHILVLTELLEEG